MHLEAPRPARGTARQKPATQARTVLCTAAILVLLSAAAGCKDKKPALEWVVQLKGQTDAKAVETTVRVLAQRLKRIGIDGARVEKGSKPSTVRILLPPHDDLRTLKSTLLRSGRLELAWCDDSPRFEEALAAAPGPDGVDVQRSNYVRPDGQSGRDTHFEFGASKLQAVQAWGTAKLTGAQLAFGPAPSTGRLRSYVLEPETLLTGDAVESAALEKDAFTGRPTLMVRLDAAGAKAFADGTEANVGRRLAIVLEGVVDSAPVVQEKIPGGSFQLSLGTDGAALETQRKRGLALAQVMGGGELPAELELVSEQAISPAN